MKKFFATTMLILMFLAVGYAVFYFLILYDANEVTGEQVREKELNTSEYTVFSALTEEEKKVYLRLTAAFDERLFKVDLGNNKINPDSMKRVWTAILSDNPEYFWSDSYEYVMDHSSQLIESLTIISNLSAEEIDVRANEIDTVADNIINTMPEGLDDYGVVKYFHDWIVTNVTYDITAPEHQNIYSVFMGRRSVCAGYSKALQYLLDKKGIFSSYVTGEAVGRGPHAWNIVLMNGEYYYVDATRDDPNFIDDTPVEDNFVLYINFGVTTADIQSTHIIDESMVTYPVLTATKDNYFVRENRVYNLNGIIESSRLMNDLRDAADAGQTYYSVRFTETEMMDQAIGMIESNTILHDYSIRFMRSDEINVMTFFMELK